MTAPPPTPVAGDELPELAALRREVAVLRASEASFRSLLDESSDPIFSSHCHSVRRDPETWQRLEAYVSEHTEAQFSHGICPTCLERHFPGGGPG